MAFIMSSLDSVVNILEGHIESIRPLLQSPIVEQFTEFVTINKSVITWSLILGTGLVWYKYCDVDLTLLTSQLLGSSPRKQLANKVIWITGASSGIGEALAYELARNVPNCRLVLTGTNETKLKEVSTKCQQLSGSNNKMTMVLALDMRQADSLADGAIEEIVSTFGTLDILVANAGRSQRALFHHVDTQVDREMFEINVFGGIKLTRSAISYWKSVNKQDAMVVISSSVAGKLGAPFSCTYTASKFALHGYFECLRIEQYPWLSVLLVCAGPVVTPVVERAFTSQPGQVWGKKHADDSSRIPVARCARLYAVAMANKLDEVWISRNPLLLSVYAYQYCPSFMRKFATPWFARSFIKLRDGEVSITSK